MVHLAHLLCHSEPGHSCNSKSAHLREEGLVERKQVLSSRRALFSGRHITSRKHMMSNPNLVVARPEVCLHERPVRHRVLHNSKSLARKSKSSPMSLLLLYGPLMLHTERRSMLLNIL